MNVFVAGASGAIGRRLVPLLLAAGHNVSAVTRDPFKALELERDGVRAYICDVFDAQNLRHAALRANPEVVVHQLTDLPQNRAESANPAALARNARIRVEGTRNLVAAAQAAGASRIVAQSLAFAYAPGPEPHRESDPLDAATRGSVISLEQQVLGAAPLRGCVLRFGFFYGPGTWYRDPPGSVPCHVDAAAWATWLAIQRSATGTFNIAEERGYADCTRAHAELGWDPAMRVALPALAA